MRVEYHACDECGVRLGDGFRPKEFVYDEGLDVFDDSYLCVFLDLCDKCESKMYGLFFRRLREDESRSVPVPKLSGMSLEKRRKLFCDLRGSPMNGSFPEDRIRYYEFGRFLKEWFDK